MAIFFVRSMAHERGWYGRGGGGGGGGCATALQAQHSSVSVAHSRPHPGLYQSKTKRTVRSAEPTAKASSASSPYSLPKARAGSPLWLISAVRAVRQAGPSRGRFALPQATPLERKIPVQFLWSPWVAHRHCNSQAFTTADLPRQVPHWNIFSETDYMTDPGTSSLRPCLQE